ncbi:MAG: response regulator [Treponema sp.]|nr:response regulator [Treponema sp.]
MNFLKRIIRYGLYNGLNKDQYLAINDEINNHNRAMLIILSSITMILSALMVVVSFTFGVIKENKYLYAVILLIFSFLFFISKFAKRKKTNFYKFLAMIWIITFVAIGLFFAVKPSSINDKTTLFLVFNFIGPMFFCIPGFSFTLITLFLEAVYIGIFFTIGRYTDNFLMNVVNSVVYALGAIMCGNVVMGNKAKSMYHAFENLRTEELEHLNASLRQQYNIVNSISFMFYAVYYGDLEKNTVTEISHFEPISIAGEDNNSPSKIMNLICEKFISEKYAPQVRKLADTEYLQDELKNKDFISLEFLGLFENWGRIICIPVEKNNGKTTKVLWCFENIDEQKKREFASQKLLMDALDAAKKADHAKSTFLFNMSHDIRTPMNAILGYASLLDKNNLIDESQRRYVSGILSSGNQLLGLINSVLETARIESGKMELNEDIIFIEKVKDNIFDVFKPLSDNKKLELSVEVDVTHSYVYADAVKINEIVMNIVSNAIKYTDHGSVKVKLTEEQTEDKDVGNYVLSVKDTGIGISEKFLPHIFESFSREKTATESNIAGTGLGLDITKKLIELMGGTIDVKSELGKGSEFICSIPFKISNEEDYRKKHEHGQIDEYSLKDMRILLAEDNMLNADIGIEILSDYGAEVEWVKNGQACIDALCSHDGGYYSLILMDVQMPVMDGIEATKKIRCLQDKEKADIAIVAMTANAFEEDRKNCLSAGMNGFISKPIRINLVMKTLSDVLQTV